MGKTMKRKRVYVAGAYTPTDQEKHPIIETFMNMNVGIRAATKIMLMKHVPFCPWIDFHFFLALEKGQEITMEDIYEYSIGWLEVSDCMWVLPGWENSYGTKKEIEVAEKLGIPIFYTFEELEFWLKE
jgi:hypothetical protein